jgi:tRNA G18 (ribose-2'-O)-methylase SpoU
MFSLDARAESLHTEIAWTSAAAVIVGAEGSGFGDRKRAGTLLRIPMKSAVESLNVAVALGIVLYEAARQRGFEI